MYWKISEPKIINILQPENRRIEQATGNFVIIPRKRPPVTRSQITDIVQTSLVTMASGGFGAVKHNRRSNTPNSLNHSNNQSQHELDPTILMGCANLLDEIDKRMLVVLRDGRTLIGILRSVDQFANLILHQAVERIHVGSCYGDIPRGVFLVRGDNVVLLGEIDKEKEDNSNLKCVAVDTILAAQREEQEDRSIKEMKRNEALKQRGMSYLHDTGVNDDMY